MATVQLGTKAVESIVKLKVNGTLTDFIVVHQGKPSSIYDESCNGTWLLIKDCYENRQWHSSNVSDYANSAINAYLNSTFLNLFDATTQAQIKLVKIPYCYGRGLNGTIKSGANGLATKTFLLGCYEVGLKKSDHNGIPGDGVKLDYFGYGVEAESKRGADISWITRSADVSQDAYGAKVWVINSSGTYGQTFPTNARGIRPALIMPSNLLVSDDGTITTNTAPTTPGSITIPSTIQGGSTITVQWTASTDAESNLDGYKVERSTDGGNSWSQIYQGGSLSTTNTVPFGTETVMYRVRAYDTEGLYSTCRNSAQVSVFNNTAPNTPAGITVPETVLGGGTLTVTWGAASDPDNNLTGYELERQVDGGNWSQVYKGANTSYTDSITRGWASVNYRVRSCDAYDAVSGYTTGTARTVNNNRAPAFTCDTASGSDLGTKSAGFSVAYSVGDADNDAVTVTEAIDGVELRTFSATLGGSNTFAVTGGTFFKILNGAHVLTATASDGKASAVHKLTFTKSVTAASITLAEPMEADDKITLCVLSVAGDIPADATYSVQVTNNANDTAPVWEDCTTEVKNGGNHIFTNETAVSGFAFNFKVEAARGTSGIGGYISSVQGGFQ